MNNGHHEGAKTHKPRPEDYLSLDKDDEVTILTNMSSTATTVCQALSRIGQVKH